MSSAAQAFANKQNAQASTGPITPEGKAASSRNATSHGLSSTVFALLPGEDSDAYQLELARYHATFRPQDPYELRLVELMVQSLWKQSRAERMEQALVIQMMKLDAENTTAEAVVAAALLNGTAGPYKTLLRYQSAAERSYFKAIKELQTYRKGADIGSFIMNMPLPGTLPKSAPPPPPPPAQPTAAPQPEPPAPPVQNEPNSPASAAPSTQPSNSKKPKQGAPVMHPTLGDLNHRL